MRIGLALALSLALAFPAVAQTEPQRHPFTKADCISYFGGGVRRYVSVPAGRQGLQEVSLSGATLVLRQTEAGPKWDPASLYPFVKTVSSDDNRLGAWDKTLKAYVYRATEADVKDTNGYIVWLSKNNRPEISTDDVRVGSVDGYNRSIAKKHGIPFERYEDWFRGEIMGKWSMRCAFLQDDVYEVECVHTHITDGSQQVRRYLKQTGIS